METGACEDRSRLISSDWRDAGTYPVRRFACFGINASHGVNGAAHSPSGQMVRRGRGVVTIRPPHHKLVTSRSVVPPFYLIRATNGFFAAAGDALFTAKEARCIPETAFGFVCLPSATLLARQEVPAKPCGGPGGVFIATREPSNGTQRCSGREPLVPMMEPADLGKRHDRSGAAGLNQSPLGGVLAQR